MPTPVLPKNGYSKERVSQIRTISIADKSCMKYP